jgi:hypothetical protein
MRWILNVLTWVILVPMYPLWYLYCRSVAEPCPCCGEKWFTELVQDDYVGEDWHCRSCGSYWHLTYRSKKG